MAMAAALAKQMGANISMSGFESVSKSFPEFWKVLEAGGVRP